MIVALLLPDLVKIPELSQRLGTASGLCNGYGQIAARAEQCRDMI